MFTAIKELYTGKSYDFVSPYPLDETSHRLDIASIRDDSLTAGKLLLVTQQALDDTSYRFIANKAIGRNMIIETTGLVEAIESSVHVTGQVRVNEITLTVMTIITVGFSIGGVLVLLSPTAPNFLIPIWIIVAVGLVYQSKKGQDEMYGVIMDVLGSSKKKR